MLIHGRLILTAHSFMLDEVRSLLQKSLRRKENDLILQSCKELLGYGKDQLPWKSVLTFLFEDHCLSDETALRRLYAAYQRGSKYDFVKILMKCKTCRLAACIPVVAMTDQYYPTSWDADIIVDTSLQGLVPKKSGGLDVDRLLAHLVRAWQNKNEDELITYIKMATIAFDYEKRDVTKKGEAFIMSVSSLKGKIHVGLVFLAALYKNTEDAKMKQYTYYCFLLAAIRDAPVRLIMCAPVVRLLFGVEARQAGDLEMQKVNWQDVPVLSQMPGWAVDKHTFRGKFGKGTKHLIKKKPKDMTEEAYDEFHGPRPLKTIKDFFEEGAYTVDSSIDANPYWDRTVQVYFTYPKRQQKTVHMTAVFYKELKKKYRELFLVNKPPRDHRSDSNSDVHKNKGDVTEAHALAPRVSRKRSQTASTTLQGSSHEKPENTQPRKKRKSDHADLKDKPEVVHSKKRVHEKDEKKGEKKGKKEGDEEKVIGLSGNSGKTEKKVGSTKLSTAGPFRDKDPSIIVGPSVGKGPSGDAGPSVVAGHSVGVGHSVGASPSAGKGPSVVAGPSVGKGPSVVAGPSVGKGPSADKGPSGDAGPSVVAGPSADKGPSGDAGPSVDKDPSVGAGPSVDTDVIAGWPLLQLPTGSAKVYTRADIKGKRVWKGPYKTGKIGLTLFYHRVMKEVLLDPHTLDVQDRRPFLVFPLLADPDAEIKVSKRSIKDVISKKYIEDQEFVERETLGIIQMHRYPIHKFHNIPASFWGHFAFRYALNIGDSGMYNALTDKNMTFLFGIDMEEGRGKPAPNTLTGTLFSKEPAKAVREKIVEVVRKIRKELLDVLGRDIDYNEIDSLAGKYSVNFDKERFIKRLAHVRKLVAALKEA